jgi:hypothetical protein
LSIMFSAIRAARSSSSPRRPGISMSGPAAGALTTLSRIDAADQAHGAPRRQAEAQAAWEPRIVAPAEVGAGPASRCPVPRRAP